ncbi:MAG TPA: sugar phosphate isomerase/epimerase family protein [Candidatus Hydrogenedentes bacterium]|nr:sugar phosphate isomerase/epimerase family protein [Candidatus Hydrogenedentota bacterium]HQH68434.1 sugar phosphate isomerase/epimerase family protein [Candidatus Hydrogenedentota bacterium]HQM50374.1 sugar phosphate isomerase/epimerase family protein [Candidatus Hydrogenedentota bacterium]
MKIGFNMLLWTPFVTEDHFPLFEKLKAVGYDGVEVPLFSGEPLHYAKVARALNGHGLSCTAVTVIPDRTHNPISADKGDRDRAAAYLKWAVDCAAELHAEVLCGPYYQPLGVFSGKGPTEEEKKRAAEVHWNMACVAQDAGVLLTIEALNRFECYFLNTLRDAADYVRRVQHPNFKAMYDTFHGNVEEKDPVGCIRDYAGVLGHFHVSASDRGTPGRDHVPWAETFRALRCAGYDGWLTIEAFGRTLPDLAATTCVWRDLSGSPEEVYTEGFHLIAQGMKEQVPA